MYFDSRVYDGWFRWFYYASSQWLFTSVREDLSQCLPNNHALIQLIVSALRSLRLTSYMIHYSFLKEAILYRENII